jgi:hypothetical protein
MNPNNKISFVNRLLIQSSGASIELLRDCPRFELTKYSSIGLTVIFTALLAVVSSFFALSLVFDLLALNVVLALFWGAIIFNLDRYIISSMRPSENKFYDFLKATPRFFIAITIAIIISKPLELKIFKSEVDSFLKMENADLISKVELKYAHSLEENTLKKTEVEEQYATLLMLREQYYEDYKCECDGTCGTKNRGRGIECFSKKEKYEMFQSELLQEKMKRDSILTVLASNEIIIKNEITDQKEIVSSSLSFGLLDQIRALNSLDSFSSLFIVLMFVLIEITPIITKLLSSKGPYENLLLEYEKKFEVNYLKALDNLDHERMKNQKLKEMSAKFELRSKEKQIQDIIKQDAHDRYDKIRSDLENKISKN